jgi:hypothetical protein
MPDPYMNLTDEEAAALGCRRVGPRRAPRQPARRQRPEVGGFQNEPAALIVGAVMTLVAVAVLAPIFSRHPARPQIGKVPAQRYTQESSPVITRQSPQSSPAQNTSAANPAQENRTERSTNIAAAAANARVFPSPAILALGWRCGNIVQAVGLFDGPARNPIGVLPVGAQLYYSPYFQGCWTQILSAEGRVLGYACVQGQEP